VLPFVDSAGETEPVPADRHPSAHPAT
jgi:hypothetical protein